MAKVYYCKSCGAVISRNAANYGGGQCWSCSKMGKQNSNWSGASLRKYICTKCGTEISRNTANYGSGLCSKCARLNANYSHIKRGAEHPLYIHGKSSIPHYCSDCGKEIGWRAMRCGSCASKLRIGSKNSNYGKRHPRLNQGKSNPMYGKPCPSKVNNYKGGYYKGIWMKSSWEILYARWLDLKKISWLYEPTCFELVVHGRETTYRPDFYLPKTDEYKEVKGYWRDDAKEKYEVFKKTYPQVRISLVDWTVLKSTGAV